MRKKIILFLIILLTVFVFGYYYLAEFNIIKSNLMVNDVKIVGDISYFNKASQLETYLNLDITYKPEEEIMELRKNIIKVNFKWELTPEKMLESYEQNELYYPPYLVIIQPEQWTYLGTGPCPSSISSVGSLPGEIYENVLNGNLDYDWNNVKDKALIKVLQPISFAQGIANIAYLNQSNNSISKEFKGYFIYYNPITKTGWFKPVEF